MPNSVKGAARKGSRGFKDHPENINRKGRPKVGLTVAERIRDAMNEPAKGMDGYTKFDQMVDLAMQRARAGSYSFWEALMQRAYGKVPDQVAMTVEKNIDLSALTDDEIATLQALLKKAKAE